MILLRKMRSRWALILLTALDLWLIAADLPKLAGVAWQLGHRSDDPAAPWWTWLAGVRGWAPPEGLFEWQASWAWPLVSRQVNPGLVLAFVGLAGLGAAALLLIDRWDRARPSAAKIALGLALLSLAGWVLEDLALAIRAGNPFQQAADLVQNPGFSGFFVCAQHLQRWEHLFSGFVDIVSTHPDAQNYIQHPPGGVLFYRILMGALRTLPSGGFDALLRLVEGPLGVVPHPLSDNFRAVDFVAATFGAQLILLWSALVVVPCFFLARRLARRDRALRLSALGLLIPSVLLMSPTLDQTFAMVSATVLAFFLEGLERRPLLFGALAGSAGAVGLFLSYAFWILAFPVAAIALARGAMAYRSGDTVGLRRAIGASACMLLAAIALWLGVWLGAGFDFPRSLRLAGQVCNEFNSHRPYRVWVWLDLVDFFQHLGPPLVWASALFLFDGQGGARASNDVAMLAQGGRSQRLSVNWYLALFWALMLALDLTGWNRGEVARLWIFLMPCALLGLYRAVGRGSIDKRSLASLAVAQFLVCAFMARYIKNFS